MDDLIRRQAAIDAFWKLEAELRPSAIDAVLDMLKNLPSAQPERKKGTWEPMFNGQFKGGAYWFSCSKCNRVVPEVRNGGWNFCPNCGSYNGGERTTIEVMPWKPFEYKCPYKGEEE